MKHFLFLLCLTSAVQAEHYGERANGSLPSAMGGGINSAGACDGRAATPKQKPQDPEAPPAPIAEADRKPLNLSEPPRRPFINPTICTEEFSYVYKHAQKCTCDDDRYEYRQISGVCELKEGL